MDALKFFFQFNIYEHDCKVERILDFIYNAKIEIITTTITITKFTNTTHHLHFHPGDINIWHASEGGASPCTQQHPSQPVLP
jgi:hypothetical protein